MVELVKKGENVIVSRTFSKVYGLAGLRIGYLIAKPSIASELRKNLVAFTNVIAIQAAKTAMQEKDFYQFSLEQTKAGKQMIYETLDDLGLNYVKSQTNFVFFESGMDIQKLNESMKAEGVMVGRPFPPLMNWCRISTGTLEEVQLFCKALGRVLS